MAGRKSKIQIAIDRLEAELAVKRADVETTERVLTALQSAVTSITPTRKRKTKPSPDAAGTEKA